MDLGSDMVLTDTAADELMVSRRAVIRYIKKFGLYGRKIAGRWHVYRAALDKFVKPRYGNPNWRKGGNGAGRFRNKPQEVQEAQ